MKYEIVCYRSLCALSKFTINGIDARCYDFGEQFDDCPDKAEDYGCGDMTFKSKDPTKEVLDKYRITENEYQKIAEELEDVLSFGNCGWCI